MSRISPERKMTRMSTRSSTRLSQVPARNCTPKDETSIRSRTKRQVQKPVISLSDDSDEECSNLVKQSSALSTPRREKARTSNSDLYEISPVTPPKQKKTTNRKLPRTPEHQENEVYANVIRTPSRLFIQLSLTSPQKSVAEIKSDSSSRQKLFKDSGDENNPRNIPTKIEESSLVEQNDRFPKKEGTIYQNARRALHSTFPTELPGREEELENLRSFIKEHLRNKTSGSLYISGPPGTGKTASLNMILEEDNISSEVQKVYVNCTAIKSPTAIYSRIAKELKIKVTGKSEKEHLPRLENYLKKHHKMILLVLDEIDQLENKNQSILYTIFEWPSKPNSQLILIGIANALDLTDRTLPRLQARCELKPKLMHFAPYTKQQIIQIFTARLKDAGVLEVFSPVALQMLAGKVAAVSGDVRRALDIGRRVVELVDQSRKEVILKPVENLVNDLIDKETQETENQPKAVDLKQVVNVLNSVYGTSQNIIDENEDSFPLQQKIIICSLLLMLKKAKNKDVTIGKLHEVYRRVCTKRNLSAVDQAEFVGLCSLIETRGIIRVSGKKEARLHKVNLEWDEEEVASALKDKQLMSMILQDCSSLGNL